MSAGKELVVAGEPRVQLLPPSVKAREKAREARSLAVLLTILAVALVGLGVVYAFFSLTTAQGALAKAQGDQQTILTQQLTYAAGSQAAQQVAQSEQAISYAGSNEVLWADFVDEVQKVLPASATFDSVQIFGRAPWEAPLASESPLRLAREAKVEISLASPTMLDATTLYRALADKITGFGDAYVYESRFENDKGRYLTRISLTLNSNAFSGRYAKDALEELLTKLEKETTVPVVAAPGDGTTTDPADTTAEAPK